MQFQVTMRQLHYITVAILGFAQIMASYAQDYEVCNQNEHLLDPPQCPPFEDISTYFPYPNDCTKYFECTNGDARCIQCAKGTRWDQTLKTCNHEDLVECRIATTSTIIPSMSSLPQNTHERERSFSGEIIESPADWICKQGYQGAIGHPYDCSQFYICDSGSRPCLFACTKGLYWNPITKDCDWPWNVPTCQGGTLRPLFTGSLVNYRNFPRFDITDFEVVVARGRTEGEEPC